jgi:integrase
MTVRELLLERYAPLHMLSDRTVVLYMQTLDRFRDYLATVPGRVDPEPTLDDLDDLVVSKFLRWREITPHRGKIAARNSVLKDRTQLVAIWTYASKKKLVNSKGQQVEWPSLPPYRAVERVPRAYTSDDVAKLIRSAMTRSDKYKGTIAGVPNAWWWSTQIYVSWLTAERLGAMLALRWEHVDLEAREITFLGESRKGKTRDIVRGLNQQATDMLRAGQRRPEDIVWPWDRRPTSIWSSLRHLCKRADVTYRGFHGFRKASLSYYHAAGGDATRLADHDRPSTTRKSYFDPNIVRDGPTAPDLLPPLDLGEEPPERPAA